MHSNRRFAYVGLEVLALTTFVLFLASENSGWKLLRQPHEQKDHSLSLDNFAASAAFDAALAVDAGAALEAAFSAPSSTFSLGMATCIAGVTVVMDHGNYITTLLVSVD